MSSIVLYLYIGSGMKSWQIEIPVMWPRNVGITIAEISTFQDFDLSEFWISLTLHVRIYKAVSWAEGVAPLLPPILEISGQTEKCFFIFLLIHFSKKVFRRHFFSTTPSPPRFFLTIKIASHRLCAYNILYHLSKMTI